MAELQTLQRKVENKKVKIDVLEPIRSNPIVVEDSQGEVKEDLFDLAIPYSHPTEIQYISDFNIQEFSTK